MHHLKGVYYMKEHVNRIYYPLMKEIFKTIVVLSINKSKNEKQPYECSGLIYDIVLKYRK